MTRLSFAPADRAGAILVTGGGRGLGRAIAETLIREGHRVVVADTAGDAPAGGHFVTVDLTDPPSVVAGVAQAIDMVGPLGGLVNNAGVAPVRANIDAINGEALDTVLSVNVRGSALVTAAVSRHLIDAGMGGSIVMITSIGARQPTPGMGAYEASKAALEALTRSAAIELAPHGIRVNAVAPGPINTPMTAGLTANADALGAWVRRIPLSRIATVDDVVPAVAFLLSPLADHITGTSIAVDGGQLLT